MEQIIIRNGHVVDPSSQLNEQADILIRDGLIESIGRDLQIDDAHEIDATGKWIIPGLCDMHVHLREPGREDKETIESGTRAAAAGGYTALACMPNTSPVNDCQSVTQFIIDRAGRTPIGVYPIAAITKNLEGNELTEMGELIECGAVAFSDDGRCVANGEVLRRALEYARRFDRTIIEHCEDLHLAAGGSMHEGTVSARLGLQGIPGLAEEIMVSRDIQICEYVRGRLHIAHVSTEKSVELIRAAKQRGIRVTAEVTPHHLFLTDEAVASFDTNTKMNPPLRSERDRTACLAGLLDGTIDCIATDHAPHTITEKEVEYSLAPNGVVGLETALSLILTHLVHTRKMDLQRLVETMSHAPRKILGIAPVVIATGRVADMTIIDPEKFWVVDPSRLISKSKNTAFRGWTMRGAAEMTIAGGRIAYSG